MAALKRLVPFWVSVCRLLACLSAFFEVLGTSPCYMEWCAVAWRPLGMRQGLLGAPIQFWGGSGVMFVFGMLVGTYIECWH